MRYTFLPLLAVSGLLLAGCPADEPEVDMDPPAERPVERGPSAERPVEREPHVPMIEQYDIKIVDHSKDLEEFHLRRELGGIERMLEQGIGDRRKLESRKSEIEKKLR